MILMDNPSSNFNFFYAWQHKIEMDGNLANGSVWGNVQEESIWFDCQSCTTDFVRYGEIDAVILTFEME